MIKYHLLLALVLLLFISGANASTPTERAIERTGNTHLATELRDACQSAKDPIHCFWIGLSIAGAEAWFKSWRAHWYFGMIRPKDKSSYRRVQIYNTKRYKAQDWFFFYWDRGVYPPSRYCTSEHSSNSAVWCPNGRNNFNATWNVYKSIFIDWVKTDEPIQLQEPTSTIPDDTKSYSKPAKPNCHWFKTVEEWKTVQVDLHWSKWFLRILLEFFVWKDEKATIYICDKRK